MPHTAHKSKLVSIERLNERMNELGTRDKWYEAQHYQFSYTYILARPNVDDMHGTWRKMNVFWSSLQTVCAYYAGYSNRWKKYRNNENFCDFFFLFLPKKKAQNRNFHHARVASYSFISLSLVFHFFFYLFATVVVLSMYSLLIFFCDDRKSSFSLKFKHCIRP